jgi:hypothetical protein
MTPQTIIDVAQNIAIVVLALSCVYNSHKCDELRKIIMQRR